MAQTVSVQLRRLIEKESGAGDGATCAQHMQAIEDRQKKEMVCYFRVAHAALRAHYTQAQQPEKKDGNVHYNQTRWHRPQAQHAGV
jgi:hypothetical protein